MARTLRIAGVAAVIVLSASMGAAQGQRERGGPPRPAEKPPEYGCSFRQLNIFPNTVPDGGRVGDFLLVYQCREKTRPVDIEIQYEEEPGTEPRLVKIASDVVLEKGQHTLRLRGGNLIHGGRYITMLKADVPGGKREVTRRVDPANCRGWELKYEGKHLRREGCDLSLHTNPEPFKTRERITSFRLGTNCDSGHHPTDVKISWQPMRGERPEARREVVKIATDVVIPAGPHTIQLAGGGVGREGRYVLEIAALSTQALFETACRAWTLEK